jgi:hypothetical protein
MPSRSVGFLPILSLVANGLPGRRRLLFDGRMAGSDLILTTGKISIQ